MIILNYFDAVFLFSPHHLGVHKIFLLFLINYSANPFIHETFVNRDALWDERIRISIAVDFMVANELGGRKQGEKILKWQKSMFFSLFT